MNLKTLKVGQSLVVADKKIIFFELENESGFPANKAAQKKLMRDIESGKTWTTNETPIDWDNLTYFLAPNKEAAQKISDKELDGEPVLLLTKKDLKDLIDEMSLRSDIDSGQWG